MTRIARMNTDSKVPLALMPFGNSEMDVPEGQMKIAQRFNTGMYDTPDKVPKGRLKHGNNRFAFGRPFGTRIQSTTIPALKRRAIVGMSLRDTFPLNFRKALQRGTSSTLNFEPRTVNFIVSAWTKIVWLRF